MFADRTYRTDGTLTPRTHADALIHDEAMSSAQAVRMVVERCVRTTSGSDVPVQADTICLHGDGPDAIAFARRVRRALQAAGVDVKAVA